jgi:hypothetical protein
MQITNFDIIDFDTYLLELIPNLSLYILDMQNILNACFIIKQVKASSLQAAHYLLAMLYWQINFSKTQLKLWQWWVGQCKDV